jgi:hypothetical protein
LSFCLWVPGLLGLPLAFVVIRLTGRDLAMMKAGLMDTAGRKQTELAREYASIAALASVLGLVGCGLLLWLSGLGFHVSD